MNRPRVALASVGLVLMMLLLAAFPAMSIANAAPASSGTPYCPSPSAGGWGTNGTVWPPPRHLVLATEQPASTGWSAFTQVQAEKGGLVVVTAAASNWGAGSSGSPVLDPSDSFATGFVPIAISAQYSDGSSLILGTLYAHENLTFEGWTGYARQSGIDNISVTLANPAPGGNSLAPSITVTSYQAGAAAPATGGWLTTYTPWPSGWADGTVGSTAEVSATSSGCGSLLGIGYGFNGFPGAWPNPTGKNTNYSATSASGDNGYSLLSNGYGGYGDYLNLFNPTPSWQTFDTWYSTLVSAGTNTMLATLNVSSYQDGFLLLAVDALAAASGVSAHQGSSCGSESVTWTDPSAPSGSTVSNDTLVVLAPDGSVAKTVSTGGAAGSATATGLSCGTGYTCEVETWFSNGAASPFSTGIACDTAASLGGLLSVLQSPAGLSVLLVLFALAVVALVVSSRRHKRGAPSRRVGGR